MGQAIARHAVSALAITAALAGSAEVLIARIGAPLVGFWAPAGVPGPGILEAAGSGATAATALLVVVAAAGLPVSRGPWTLAATALPLAAVVLTVAATIDPSPGLLTASHLVVAAAAVGLARGAAVSLPAGRTVGTLAALGVAAGQLAFVATGDAATGLHRVAEAAIIALPIAAAWRLRAEIGHLGRVAAFIAATGVSAALVVRHGELAMLATWTFGATLTVPPLALIAAAAGWVLLAIGALRRPGVRLVAAGVTLPWIAGIQPAAIHHNLTGLLGVMLLTGLTAGHRAVEQGARP